MGVKIKTMVHPNSKRPRIEKDSVGLLHIYVKDQPLEGRANKAAKLALAEYYKVSKSSVMLVHGEKSKHKVFKII